MPTAAVIQGILALLAAAPQAVDLALQAKRFFGAMFEAGLISKEIQNALDARVDSNLALFRGGIIPPEFVVRPDPATPAA